MGSAHDTHASRAPYQSPSLRPAVTQRSAFYRREEAACSRETSSKRLTCICKERRSRDGGEHKMLVGRSGVHQWPQHVHTRGDGPRKSDVDAGHSWKASCRQLAGDNCYRALSAQLTMRAAELQVSSEAPLSRR